MSEYYYDDYETTHRLNLSPVKFIHPISQPDTIHNFLSQKVYWIDTAGEKHKIKDMDKEYLFNVLSWMEKNKERIEFTWRFLTKLENIPGANDGLWAFDRSPLVTRLKNRYAKLIGIERTVNSMVEQSFLKRSVIGSNPIRSSKAGQ